MYVIVVTMGGGRIIGPFTSEQDAITYARSEFVVTRWFVRPITPPTLPN